MKRKGYNKMKIANYDKSIKGTNEVGTHVIKCEVKGLELWVREIKIEDAKNENDEPKTGLSKTFRLRYRSNGTQKRITLGKYPLISFKDVKESALEFLRSLHLNGVDPIEKDRLGTFKSFYEKWIIKKKIIAEQMEIDKKIIPGALRLKTAVSYESALRIHCEPLHDLHIMDIKEEDVNILIESVKINKSAALAHKVRSAIASMYRDIVATSSLIRKSPVTPASTVHVLTEGKGQEPLTDEQIKEVWERIIKIDPIRRGLIKIALYTGMRKRNLEFMEWQELSDDLSTWTMPAHKYKGKRVHSIPLSIQAQEVLQEMKQHKDKSGIYVFPFRSSKTPANPSRLHEALLSFGLGFTTHAFRKTVETIMDELDINPKIIDLCIGHISESSLKRTYTRRNVRTRNGVTATDEKKILAYQEYADEIERIILGYYDNNKNGVKKESMISIVNVSKTLKETGKHNYALKINGRMIAKFDHNREEDLATCLLKASKAVESMKSEKE